MKNDENARRYTIKNLPLPGASFNVRIYKPNPMAAKTAPNKIVAKFISLVLSISSCPELPEYKEDIFTIIDIRIVRVPADARIIGP
jgi:hypothetical protein